MGGCVHHDTGVLQADEGDEQADTHGNASLQGQGNGVENGFTDIGQGQDDEDQTFHEDRQQGDLPAVAEAQHYGVGQVGVQAHAGGQHEGQVGHEGHAAGGDEGGDGRRQQDSGGIHARVAQNAGVDCQDVGHGHEGGQTGHQFRLDGGAVLFQLKNFIKHTEKTFLLFLGSHTLKIYHLFLPDTIHFLLFYRENQDFRFLSSW